MTANLQSPISDLLADRRQRWQQLTPQQQMQRVQYALLDFQDYAMLRRKQARRQQSQRKAKAYDPL